MAPELCLHMSSSEQERVSPHLSGSPGQGMRTQHDSFAPKFVIGKCCLLAFTFDYMSGYFSVCEILTCRTGGKQPDTLCWGELEL